MKCLNCNARMINNVVQTKKDQISYDMCEDCGSFWLDRGELDKMAFQVNGSIEYCSKDKIQDSAKSSKNCPRCDETALDKVTFIGSDIVLDRCRNCGGFWLDGGEPNLINKELEEIMPVKGQGFSDFVNNIHLPYWYKRVRRDSSETDFRMEVPPIKGSVLETETKYACPACNVNMNLYKVLGIGFEGCPKCKGIFLDKSELRKLKDRATKGSWNTLRWLDDEVEAVGETNAMPSKRLCPKCESVKFVCTSFGSSKIIIDWCPGCQAVWLDRDEFQEIVSYLRDKLNKLSSADVAKEAYQEIKEIWNGPENKISEILDAKATIWALINIIIFEHPALCQRLIAYSQSIPIK